MDEKNSSESTANIFLSGSQNKLNVQKFLTNVKVLQGMRGPFPPYRIYNSDETSLSTVHEPPTILAPEGIKHLGSMTSGKREQNINLDCCH
jgi:hypothetical protein